MQDLQTVNVLGTEYKIVFTTDRKIPDSRKTMDVVTPLQKRF